MELEENYKSGFGIRKIGDELASEGIYAKEGKKFAYNTVKSILTNPKYKGIQLKKTRDYKGDFNWTDIKQFINKHFSKYIKTTATLSYSATDERKIIKITELQEMLMISKKSAGKRRWIKNWLIYKEGVKLLVLL